MSNQELEFSDLHEIAHEIASGEISSREITEAMLARIERLDPLLGSYTCVLAESALREAEAADLAVARGEPLSALHGVPIAVKDLCDVAGAQTVAGMPRVRGKLAPADKDATVVARFREAGAVLLGKLQLTEGAVAHHHPDIKPPVNPHNADYWSGASSSGSGVATAAGLCFGSLGSDTGGSIRFPSFANGITGLKPTWGRVSRAGVFPLSWSLDHIGPMARSSADCAAMLSVIAGSDADDPTALPQAVPDYVSEIHTGIADLTIGFDEDYASRDVDEVIVKAIREALLLLGDAGANIVPINFPDTAPAVDIWGHLCTPEAAAAHAASFPSERDAYGPRLAELLDGGLALSACDYALAHQVRQQFSGALMRVFASCDLIIAPSFMRQNLTTKEFETFGDNNNDWPDLLRFTAPFDIAGTPTLSLPAGFNEHGAPFGFQLLAGHLDESKLLRAGYVYQASTVWHRQRPRQLPPA